MEPPPPTTPPPSPRVSIVLPTYNRARFLPEAFGAIRDQTFADWELIVVDDGSTDETAELVAAFAEESDRPVCYVRQENAGAYAARVAGVQRARGEFVACYDSDDLWLPEHLETLRAIVDRHPEVSWACAAGVSVPAGQAPPADAAELTQPLAPAFAPFATPAGDCVLLGGEGLATAQIRVGLRAALQFSLIRADLLRRVPMRTDLRNGEDRFFLFRCMKAGATLARTPRVTTLYREHDDHSSCATSEDPAVTIRVYGSLVRGYADLRRETDLSPREDRAVLDRLANAHFWGLGYNGYWQIGDAPRAFASFRQGLTLCPWRPVFWKTYLACRLRSAWAAISPGRRSPRGSFRRMSP